MARKKRGIVYNTWFSDKARAAYWKQKYLALKREYDRDQRFMRSLK